MKLNSVKKITIFHKNTFMLILLHDYLSLTGLDLGSEIWGSFTP